MASPSRVGEEVEVSMSKMVDANSGVLTLVYPGESKGGGTVPMGWELLTTQNIEISKKEGLGSLGIS